MEVREKIAEMERQLQLLEEELREIEKANCLGHVQHPYRDLRVDAPGGLSRG